MISAVVLRTDGPPRIGVPYAEAMALVRPPEGPPGSQAGEATCSVWLDVEAPDPAELRFLSEELGFHPLAVEDCVHPQKRAKLERYRTHGFVVLSALDRTTRHDLMDTLPVAVFVRRHLVVSVHTKRVTAIERVAHLLAEDPTRLGNTSTRVLHAMVDAVIDEFPPLLEDLEDILDELEARAARPSGDGLLDRLVAIRRQLLLIRRIMLPHVEVLRRLVDEDAPEATAETRFYFRDVLDHALVVSETTTLLLEVANGAISVHANAVNERINEVMKFLAIVSTLLLPWTVIGGIFGMNFEIIPLSHQPTGFFVAMALMGGCTAALLYYFQRKGWMTRPGRTPRRPPRAP